jgi:hypothetical protein
VTIAEWLAHPRMQGLELVRPDPWWARIHYCAPDGTGSYYAIGRGDTPEEACQAAYESAKTNPFGFGGSL